MKKIFIAVFCVLFFAAGASAEFGFKLKGGVTSASNDIDKFDTDIPISANKAFLEKSVEKPWMFGFSVFYDKPAMFGMSDRSHFGVELGYKKYSKAHKKMAAYYDDSIKKYNEVETNVHSIPLTFYYKYNVNKKFNVTSGIGLEILSNQYTRGFLSGEEKITEHKTQNRAAPHLTAGAEWRISKLFGVQADLGYLFNADFNSGGYTGFFENSLSGLRLELSLNVYIL